MDPWEYIVAGRFQEAVEAYTIALRDRPSSPKYGNRAIAYLNLGLLEYARADFEAAERSRPPRIRGVEWSEWNGTLQWLSGKADDAVQTWQEAARRLQCGEIQYSDGARGVQIALLLWFAAVRQRDTGLLEQCRKILRERTQEKRIENWPGPVALFLLGRLGRPQMLKQMSSVAVRAERELCQVEFYAAVHAEQSGNSALREESLQKAAGLRAALLEKEYYLARHEIHQIGAADGL